MPKLSIIIPVYNVEKYLMKCLDSVIFPGLENYEIIIVNDGSTDRSPELAEAYAQRYPQIIRFISTPNGGLGAARNVGLRASGAEYVCFLDSDDSLALNAVPEMLEVLRGDADIYLYDMLSVNEDGRQIGMIPGSGKSGSFTLKQYPELLCDSPCACNKLFRRSLFTVSGIEFPGRVWYEDLRTVPKLYPGAKKIEYTGKAWYLYLQRGGSITNSANAERNLEILDAVNDLRGYYMEKGLLEQYREQFEFISFHHAYLTASVRVNACSASSPVQEKLLAEQLRNHPDYRRFPFYGRLSFTHRLIDHLLRLRLRRMLHILILLNNKLKRKKL